MTFEKAKRILPSCAAHCANGISDLSVLRARVEGEAKNLTMLLLETIQQTHTGAYRTAEAKAIDLKLEQLNRFLEATK